MYTSGLMSGLYTASQWITRMVYVNLLWLLFSVVGLILFGFFPATAAMLAVIRKWIMGDTDLPVFKSFWNFFKKDFIKTNMMGYFICLLGFILYVDYQFIQNTTNELIKLTLIPLIVVIFLFILMALYVFPTFVHYDTKTLHIFKNAFIIMMVNPMANIMMIFGFICLYFLMTTIPGLIPFIGGSGFALTIMGSTYYAFIKVQRKQEAAAELEEEAKQANEKQADIDGTEK